MNLQTISSEKLCPRSEIAAYLDGELSPREEFEIEIHFADCSNCAAELNEQKNLLRALDFVLEEKCEIELPANFTKTIVAAAENNVSGLRRPQERFKALSICFTLFLLVLLGLGAETETVFSSFRKFGDQFLAVISFSLHLVFDVSVGTTIILRSLSRNFLVNSTVPIIFLAGISFVALLAFTRFIGRYNRA